MKTLPNGIRVFNATPHIIRFWCEEWAQPIEVAPDEKIDARPTEEPAGYIPGICPECRADSQQGHEPNCPCWAEAIPIRAQLVRTRFVGTDEGQKIIVRARAKGADVIVGSIIAARAYPGRIVNITPAPGYVRVPPAEKRMNPDKFTTF